jgi:hypothetical protein
MLMLGYILSFCLAVILVAVSMLTATRMTARQKERI